MKYIEISSIVCRAKPGAEIYYCLTESIKLCAEREEDVILIHNEKKYLISFKALLDSIPLP